MDKPDSAPIPLILTAKEPDFGAAFERTKVMHVASQAIRREQYSAETFTGREFPPDTTQKSYGRFETIVLDAPEARTFQETDLRSSYREFFRSLNKIQLEKLLFEIVSQNEERRRTYPSAGMLYPAHCYIFIDHVDDLPRGIYYFDMNRFELKLVLRENLLSKEIIHELTSQVSGASAVLIFSLELPRVMRKYAARGYRYGLVEIGAIAMLINMVSVSNNVGCCWVGGFDDEVVSRAIGVDWDIEYEAPMLLMALGSIER